MPSRRCRASRGQRPATGDRLWRPLRGGAAAAAAALVAAMFASTRPRMYTRIHTSLTLPYHIQSCGRSTTGRQHACTYLPRPQLLLLLLLLLPPPPLLLLTRCSTSPGLTRGRHRHASPGRGLPSRSVALSRAHQPPHRIFSFLRRRRRQVFQQAGKRGKRRECLGCRHDRLSSATTPFAPQATVHATRYLVHVLYASCGGSLLTARVDHHQRMQLNPGATLAITLCRPRACTYVHSTYLGNQRRYVSSWFKYPRRGWCYGYRCYGCCYCH